MKKLIPQLILLILTCIACVTASFGWFSMNKKASTAGVEIGAKSDLVEVKYNIYRYNDEICLGEDITNLDDSLVLPTYDSIILSKNEYTSIIIKLTLTNITTANYLSCDITCLETDTDKNVLSNILSIDIAQIDILSTDANDIYLAANDYFVNNTATEKTFIINGRKEQTINFDLSNFLVINDEIEFYIELNYDEELIANKDFFIDSTSFDINLLYHSDLSSIMINWGCN